MAYDFASEVDGVVECVAQQTLRLLCDVAGIAARHGSPR